MNLAINDLGQLLTTSATWEAGTITDAELIDLAQLQARPVGCGCIAGLQFRVHAELCQRRLMANVIDLVYAGHAVPEELT